MSVGLRMATNQDKSTEVITQWFHIFKSMVDSGDVAAMGPHAFTVYIVIKSHVNFTTGKSFPSIDTIIEKSGISERQVKRELVKLEELGYITKKKVGRHNEYLLREKISIPESDGRPSAIASWDYVPGGVQHAVADLKNVMLTGNWADAKIVHIDHLQVNITEVKDGGVLNIQNFGVFDNLPEEMKRKLIDAYSNKQNKSSK